MKCPVCKDENLLITERPLLRDRDIRPSGANHSLKNCFDS